MRNFFKRKRRLDRGLPNRKLQPETRWLVKTTARQHKQHARIATRVRRIERGKETQAFFDLMAMCFIVPAVFINVVYAGIYHVPVKAIEMVSPTNAEFIDKLRLSGCADSYARAVLVGPLKGKLGQHFLEQQYRDCAYKRMDFPA